MGRSREGKSGPECTWARRGKKEEGQVTEKLKCKLSGKKGENASKPSISRKPGSRIL